MKEIFCIKDTLANKISYYHLLAFLITLPFDMFYSEWVLASLLVHTVIQLTRQKILSVRISRLFPALLYLLTVVCTLYSANKEQAFKEWEKQLAILLFPLIFSVTPIDFRKYKIPLLKAFAITCTITVLYLFYAAWSVIGYYKLPESVLFSTAFTNHNFSLPIDLHATYFSMYITLSLAVFFYLLTVSRQVIPRIFYVAGCLVLFAGMFQLSSRATFIAALLIINLVIPFFLFGKIARWRFMIISGGLSMILLCLLATMEPFRDRFIVDLKQDLTAKNIDKQNPLDPRMARWRCAWELIGKSPFAGYGTGSETGLLKQKYYERHLYTSYLHELNAHNQYLSFLLKTGITGIVLYLYILFAGFWNAIREKDVFFCSFLLIATIVSFSENILDVNKGIFFFSFFYSYFMYACTDFRLPFFSRND